MKPESDLAASDPLHHREPMPEKIVTQFSLDRTAFSVGRLHDDDSQVDYWLSQPPERRIAAVELLRRSLNPEAYVAQRLHGFFEAAKRT